VAPSVGQTVMIVTSDRVSGATPAMACFMVVSKAQRARPPSVTNDPGKH
jgi:hypothetical protein